MDIAPVFLGEHRATEHIQDIGLILTVGGHSVITFLKL